MYAHYFKVSARVRKTTGFSHEVIISPSQDLSVNKGFSKPCGCKAMARQIAKHYDAIPHNF